MIRVVTDSVVEPVSISEIAQHLNIDTDVLTAKTPYLEMLQVAARQYIEAEAHISLTTQTIEETIEPHLYPSGAVFALQKLPLIAITKVEVYDKDENEWYEHTIVGGSITIERSIYPNRITIHDLSLDVPTHIKVTYTAGYGATADDVPALIKWTILSLISYMDQHKALSDPNAMKTLLQWIAPYRNHYQRVRT